MASKLTPTSTFFLIIASMLLLFHTTEALSPYSRSPSGTHTMFPSDHPFRILEKYPLSIPRTMGMTPLTLLARADWWETVTEHVIAVDIPGMKKEHVKIEVEDNMVVRISGERKTKEDVEIGVEEKWHRAERTNRKFTRQFIMPVNADLDQIRAKIEDGVLRIVVPKHKETKRQLKVISIV